MSPASYIGRQGVEVRHVTVYATTLHRCPIITIHLHVNVMQCNVPDISRSIRDRRRISFPLPSLDWRKRTVVAHADNL